MSKIKITMQGVCPLGYLGDTTLNVLWFIEHGDMLTQYRNISYVHCQFWLGPKAVCRRGN